MGLFGEVFGAVAEVAKIVTAPVEVVAHVVKKSAEFVNEEAVEPIVKDIKSIF